MKPTDRFQELYTRAHEAGMAAGARVEPVPMVVQQRANPMDDASPVVRQDFVADGVCGFAWVVVRPGNCPFANWLKKMGLARAHYGGGVSVWIAHFGQSMQRKEAYARAFAKVLSDAGLRAFADSRMD